MRKILVTSALPYANGSIHLGHLVEYIQTDIKANHLAIVDAGRCGAACRLTLDHFKKEKKIMIITIDGIKYDVQDEQLAQAIAKQQSIFDAKEEAFKKKEKEDEEEKEKMKKDKEQADAAKDAALKTVLDADAINKLVSDRAELLSTASMILTDKMPECKDCPKEIKIAVIDKILDLGDLSAKSMDYLDASFDIAVKKYHEAKKSTDKLANDLKDNDGKVITRDSAREKYKREQLNLV